MKLIDAELFLKMLEKGHEDGSICGPEDVEELVRKAPAIEQLRNYPVFKFPEHTQAITISVHESKKTGEKSTVSIKFPYDGHVYGTYISFDEMELPHSLMLNACSELLFCYREMMKTLKYYEKKEKEQE